MKYITLTIRYKRVPDNFNGQHFLRWVGEWAGGFLIEDYENLIYDDTAISSVIMLYIPENQIRPSGLSDISKSVGKLNVEGYRLYPDITDSPYFRIVRIESIETLSNV